MRTPTSPLTRVLAPLAAASLTLTLMSPGRAQPVEAAGLPAGAPVLAVVEVPKPWYVPRFVVTGKMRDTMPQYAALPGLAFKAYSFGQANGAYGGLYLWKDAASARAWFSSAWFERVQRERGVAARVRFLQVVAAVDTVPGGTLADADSTSVATLAVAAQAAEPVETLVAADRLVPGLLRRYRVLDAAGRALILSLWRDASAARQQLDAASQAGAEWFDTPILLPNKDLSNLPLLPGLSGPRSAQP